MNVFDEWGRLKAAIVWCVTHHADVYFRTDTKGITHVTMRAAGIQYVIRPTFIEAVIECKRKYDAKVKRVERLALRTKVNQ